MSHSQSPWIAHRKVKGGDYCRVENDTTVIAEVYEYKDAKLMAIAPELLETIERIEGYCHYTDPVAALTAIKTRVDDILKELNTLWKGKR